MNKTDFDFFSDKMSSLNLFFMLTLASMHVVSIWELYYTTHDAVSDFMVGICYSSMTYFFFMSGFWLFRKYVQKNYLNILINKAKTLVIPFFIWGAIKIVATEAIGLLRGEGLKYSIGEALRMLFFVHIGNINIAPLNGPLWYLARLFTYMVCAPLIYIFLKNKYVGFISLVLLAIGTIQCDYYGWLGWIFVFSLGSYIGIHYEKECISLVSSSSEYIQNLIAKTPVVKSPLILGCIVLYLILWKICVSIPGIAFLNFSDAPMRRLLCAFVPSIILPFIGGGNNNRQYSFLLYCSQTILGTWLVQIIHKVADHIPLIREITGIQQMIVWVFMICLVYLFWKIGNKLFPNLLAFILGGRGK